MPSLLDAQWVFFREDSRTHEETYLWCIVGKSPTAMPTSDFTDAMGFDTADEAYRFAEQHKPLLDNWRVGLRSPPRY